MTAPLIRIDSTRWSHLPLCTGCGWRGVTVHDTAAAWWQIEAHLQEHPRQSRAAVGRSAARRLGVSTTDVDGPAGDGDGGGQSPTCVPI